MLLLFSPFPGHLFPVPAGPVRSFRLPPLRFDQKKVSGLVPDFDPDLEAYYPGPVDPAYYPGFPDLYFGLACPDPYFAPVVPLIYPEQRQDYIFIRWI